MRIDDRVTTQVAVMAALAAQKVAQLEAAEKETPALSGTSNARLRLARKLKGARTLAASWTRVAELVAQQDETDPDGLDREFPS